MSSSMHTQSDCKYSSKKELKKASIIIVTYNHSKYILSCINSIRSQDYPHEIIVIDNNSDDATVQLVKEQLPYVKIIENKNLGYGLGNNMGVKYSTGEFIVILNPDTIAEDNWLEELIRPLENGTKIITTPKILLYNGSTINTCGLINHFTGLTFVRGLNEPMDALSQQEYIGGFSGCCFALRKNDFIELGGFDKNFFAYNEDTELSWRANLKGFKIIFTPNSLIKHDYTLKISPKKVYHLERGRYIILRKYFTRRDLLLLAPSLLVAEFLTFGYLIRYNHFSIMYKIKALWDGTNAKVDKVNGNKAYLLASLSASIPIDQLTFNKTEKIIKSISNRIFERNIELIR